MKSLNEYIDIEEAKEIFCGKDNIKKAPYADMISRTMIDLDEKSQKNLEEVMELLIEQVLVEENERAKEAMFEALMNMVGQNEIKLTIKPVDLLISKLENLSNRDLAESLIVISGTYDLRCLELMEKYKDHPDEYVREVAQESISDIKYKYKL